MARLMLSLDGQVLAEYNMNKERYTIGRLPDNDIRIDNGAVSGHHSLIINILNDSFLEDLNSTNGTYVNGKLIKKHALQHGDVITVGRHQLRFVDSGVEDDDQDEFARTMVIDSSKAAAAIPPVDGQRPATADEDTVRARNDQEPRSGPRPLPSAKIQVLNGSFAGRELNLNKALTTLGRPGIQVVAVTRRAEGFFVVMVESSPERGGPSVNGEPLTAQARKLQDNDVLELIGIKMGFFED